MGIITWLHKQPHRVILLHMLLHPMAQVMKLNDSIVDSSLKKVQGLKKAPNSKMRFV